MKHTTPGALLSRELLCFVRDHNPTAGEFAERYPGSGGHVFHVLRKHGVLVAEDDRVRLNPRHLSADGQRFDWANRIIFLDRDEVWHVNYGPPGRARPVTPFDRAVRLLRRPMAGYDADDRCCPAATRSL